MTFNWTELSVEDEKPLSVRVTGTPKELMLSIHSSVMPRLSGAPDALESGNLSVSRATEGKKTLLRVRFTKSGGFKMPKLDRIYYPLKIKQLKPATPIKSTPCEARFEDGDLIIILPETFDLKAAAGTKAQAAIKGV